MATDPRATSSASVTEVDFRSGAVRQEDEADESGRELQIASRFDDFAWQATALEPPPRERSKLLQGALAVVAVAGFATVVWFAYTWGLERGYREEIPIVRADAGPMKIRPEDPGGLVVPNQDKLVLNRAPSGAEAPTIERLLSAPEEPQALPKEPAPSALGEGETPEPVSDEGAALAGALPPVPAEPAPSESTAAAQPAQAAATPPTPPDVAPSAGAGGAKSAEGGGAAAGGSGGSSAGGESAAGKLQLAAVKKGDYVIQLASVDSDEGAQREWTRLQKAFPDLLGDMNLAVQVAEVKGVEYHRVQTGPFPSMATALDMCAQIKAKNQACIVQQR